MGILRKIAEKVKAKRELYDEYKYHYDSLREFRNLSDATSYDWDIIRAEVYCAVRYARAEVLEKLIKDFAPMFLEFYTSDQLKQIIKDKKK